MGNLNLKRSKAKAARSSEGLDPEWQSVTAIILYWLKQIIRSAQIQDILHEVWFTGGHPWILAFTDTQGNTSDKKIGKVSSELRQKELIHK